ncbi:energy transducer TonB [Sphingomonas sp. HF-S4]|uniref:Energy transducer TonB n=1 Tax=Sphingomonas agrestis TaxID=3080540 RepID=A0ABU3Y5P0_9SPHN|nr:energy transducer TonB [Sphingomonas sp. HF-S4]MDV3456665.1 energy transducer TonB [Sphingomonas sp. HF-S4]
MLPLLLLAVQDAAAGDGGETVPVQPQTSPRDWVSVSDYPTAALNKRGFGVVHFRLTIDAAGKVSACNILNTSGFWMLDQHTCKLLTARARFVPARKDGVAVESWFISNFFWAHGDFDKKDWNVLVKEVTEPISSRVTVKKLPTNYKQAPLTRVRFDARGAADWCNVEQGSGNPAIDTVACEQALAQAERPEMQGNLPRKPDTRMFLVEFVDDSSGR